MGEMDVARVATLSVGDACQGAELVGRPLHPAAANNSLCVGGCPWFGTDPVDGVHQARLT